MARWAAFLTLLAPLGVTAEEPRAASGAIDWPFVEDRSVRFRLRWEDSRRLEPLDSKGRPFAREPEVDEVRRLDVRIDWRWTREQRGRRTAELTIDEVVAIESPRWPGGAAAPARLRAQVEVPAPGGDGAAATDADRRVEVRFRPAVSARIVRAARSPEAAAELADLLSAALAELLAHFPPEDEPPAATGARWSFTGDVALADDVELRTTTELELVEQSGAGESGPRLARIEGSIRQVLRGAPAEFARLPGLFPGTVKWIHDLEARFPRLLEAEKVTRAPIPDERLPVLDTLTHTRRLRVSLVPEEE